MEALCPAISSLTTHHRRRRRRRFGSGLIDPRWPVLCTSGTVSSRRRHRVLYVLLGTIPKNPTRQCMAETADQGSINSSRDIPQAQIGRTARCARSPEQNSDGEVKDLGRSRAHVRSSQSLVSPRLCVETVHHPRTWSLSLPFSPYHQSIARDKAGQPAEPARRGCSSAHRQLEVTQKGKSFRGETFA